MSIIFPEYYPPQTHRSISHLYVTQMGGRKVTTAKGHNLLQ